MAIMSPLPHRWFGKGGSASNSGKGFYKFTFNSGGTATPVIGETITGATSGATAIITNIDHTSGTWAGGNEVGIIYCSKPIGTFNGTENIDINGKQSNILTMTSSLTLDCLNIEVSLTGATASKGVSTTLNIVGHEKTNDSFDSTKTFSVNKGSRAVTINSALSTTITMAETTTGWTTFNSATHTASAVCAKTASTNYKLTLPASPVINTMYSVFDYGSDLDLSSFTKLCFWVSDNYMATSTKWVVKLLDSADNVLVTFSEFSNLGYNIYPQPITLTNGTNLPNNVRKFAIFSGTATSASAAIYISNIYATTNLTLDSLIGLQGEEYYPLKYVNGTSIVIDNHVYADSSTGRGYAKSNVTNQPLYIRNDFIKTARAGSSNTQVQVCQVAGTVGSPIKYEFGIDPVTLEQNGYTMYDGTCGSGYAFYIGKTYSSFNRCGAIRYYNSYKTASNSGDIYYFKDFISIASTTNAFEMAGNNVIFTGSGIIGCGGGKGMYLNGYTVQINSSSLLAFSNLSYGIEFINGSGNSELLGSTICLNNTSYGVYTNCYGETRINNLTTDNNSIAGVLCLSNLGLNNCLIGEGTEFAFGTTNSVVKSTKHNQTAGLNKTVSGFDSITMQTAIKPSDAVCAWKFSPTNAIKREAFPSSKVIGRFYATAGTAITCKARGCITNAAIAGVLKIKAPDLGLTADYVSNISTTVSADMSATDELLISFVPSVSGWFELLGQAYYPDGSSVHTYSFFISHPLAVAGNIPLFTQA